jgi:hypothetical protein
LNTFFYDTVADKLHTIPSDRHVCTYGDGKFKASVDQTRRFFQPVRWITIAANYENCGIIDFERGNPCYADPSLLLDFVNGRIRMRKRARVYHDRADTGLVQHILTSMRGKYLNWVATLDGNELSPSFLPDMWGVQFKGGPKANYDESILYGQW